MKSFLKSLAQSRFVRVWVVVMILLSVLAVAYSIWVHDYIDRVYFEDGGIGGLVDSSRHSLEHYHQRANEIFWGYIYFGIPLTLLFWYVLIRAVRLMASQCRQTPFNPEIISFRFRGEVFIALLSYVAITALYFYPIFSQFSTHLIGPPEDNMGGLWSQWWAVEKVLHGSESLTYTRHLLFPEGVSLYYNGWSFYSQVIAAIARIFCNPIASYNLVILHTFPVAGLGAFLLTRYITRNSLLALLAGFIFAFSPVHFMRSLHHMNQTAIQFVPFFALYFIRCIREGGVLLTTLAGIFLLLNALCDWNFLIMGGYFILFGYIYLLLKERRWWDSAYVIKSLAVVLITLLPLLFWLIPMFKLGMKYPGADLGGRNTFVVDSMGLLIPYARHLLHNFEWIAAANASYTGYVWESVGYLGIAALLLVLSQLRQLLRLAARLWLGVIAFLTLALGPQIHLFGYSLPIGLPYTLVAYVPFLRSARVPARFMVYLYLFWAILVVLALVYLWAKQKRGSVRVAITGIIVALLFVDIYSCASDTTRIPLPSELKEFVAREQPTAFLNLPEDYVSIRTYMAQQTILEVPMVGGETTRKLGTKLLDTLEFNDLERQATQLAGAGVSHIVIHKYSLADTEDTGEVNLSRYRARYRVELETDSLLILSVDPQSRR